jgi:7,8-dihydro-6-hydroxymethylpterin dimethyltransferase
MQVVARIRPRPNPDDRGASLRDALKAHGLWQSNQTATRRWAIGCVSLEVTQRCNLDCTLCYLSEHSEAVQDLPLTELFRRIDMIAQWYGDNTDVQVSGGDPTLRAREDLIAIVAYIRKRGMRASLFTNGILATRELLYDLAQAGLTDVAFHVDMTQARGATRMKLRSML